MNEINNKNEERVFSKELVEAVLEARKRSLKRREQNKKSVDKYKQLIIELVEVYDFETEQFKTDWLLSKTEIGELIGKPSRIKAELDKNKAYFQVTFDYKNKKDIPPHINTELYPDLVTKMLGEEGISRLLVPTDQETSFYISFPANIIVEHQKDYNEAVKQKVKTINNQ